MTHTILVPPMSNAEFLATHAAAGRIGLAGGVTLVDRVIAHAQRHVDDKHRWSQWSHAFFMEGIRVDGCHWVVESDLDFHRKHVRLGVQENRISKYHDEELYTTLAVLDFNLSPTQAEMLVKHALDLVASRCRYSVRELVGTLIALQHPSLRTTRNPLARAECFYCSAFVSHLFRTAGIDLAPGLHTKNITPEDLARTIVPHTMYIMQRAKVRSIVAAARRKIRTRVRKRARRVMNILA